MRNVAFLLVGLAAVGAACSSETIITPEKMNNQGSGGATVATATTNATNATTNAVVSTTDASSAIATTVTATASASTGGACCDQPIQVQGPVVVKTADTDANQAFDVILAPPVGTLAVIVQGPAYVTDLGSQGGYIYNFSGTSCPAALTGNEVPFIIVDSQQHGARWFVPVNHVLCSTNQMHVAGFKPY